MQKQSKSLLLHVRQCCRDARTQEHTHTHTGVFFIFEIFRNRGHVLRFVASTHRRRKIIGLQYSNVRIENKQKFLWKININVAENEIPKIISMYSVL